MAYSEDVFASAGIWDSTWLNEAKIWPTTILPESYEMRQTRPSFSNYSHNGRKFTRRSNFAKTQVTCNYPPLTHSQFLEMHSVALAAQGQYNPFILKYQPTKTDEIEFVFVESVATGDYSAVLSRYVPTGSPAPADPLFKRGQVITIDEAKPNAGFNVIVNNATTEGVTVNLNGYDYYRSTVRFAYPILATGPLYLLQPDYHIVTLADDAFEYEVDEAGFYYLSVTFDFDEWKE